MYKRECYNRGVPSGPSRARSKLLRSLRHKKYRRQHGRFLVEGVRLCGELLASRLEVEQLLVAEDRRDAPQIQALLATAGDVPVMPAPAQLIGELAGTVHTQGVVAVARMPEDPLQRLLGLERLLVCDRIADPGNLIRTAHAFGVQGVVLTRGSVEVTSDKVLRASMGGVFHLPCASGPDLPELCGRLDAFELLAAVPANGEPLRGLTVAHRWALLLGSEADGLAQVARARPVTIPMRPGAESLNVAVAGALLLYELSSEWGAS